MTHQPFSLKRTSCGLLIVDVQAKLVPFEDRIQDVLMAIQKVIRGFQILKLPIAATEQYPKGLGETLPGLKALLGSGQTFLAKTTFSALGDAAVREHILAIPATQWVVVGIEAHVCVLQTAKDLLNAGKQVVVLNDAITSRSIYDFSTAIAEMRDIGIRISSTETILFELLESSEDPSFKAISALIK